MPTGLRLSDTPEPPPPPAGMRSPPARENEHRASNSSDKPTLPPRPPGDTARKLPSPPKPVLNGLKAEPLEPREVHYNHSRQRAGTTQSSKGAFSTPVAPPPMLSQQNRANYLEDIQLDAISASVDGDESSMSIWGEPFYTINWVFLVSLYCIVTANLLAAEVTIDTIADDLGLDAIEKIIVLPATYLLMCFSGIVYGHMSDSSGRRRVLVPSLFLFAISSIGLGFVPEKYSFCVVRILQAIGGGSFFVVDSITFDVSRNALHQLKLMSAIQIFRPIGILAGSFGGDYLASNMDWQYIFWGLGAWSLLTWAYLAAFLPETRAHRDVTEYYGHYNCKEACCKLIPKSWFIGPVFLNSMIQCVFWFLFMTLESVLQDSYGFSSSEEGIASISLHTWMIFASLVFYISLVSKSCCVNTSLMFLLRLFMICSIVMVGCFAAIYFLDLTDDWLLYYIPLLFTSIISGLTYPVLMTILMQEPDFKANTGAVIGWEFFFRTLCMLVLYGYVNEFCDLKDPSTLSWWSMVGIGACNVWFWLIFGWRKASDQYVRLKDKSVGGDRLLTPEGGATSGARMI